MLAAEGTDVALNHGISARLSGADRPKSNPLSTPPKEPGVESRLCTKAGIRPPRICGSALQPNARTVLGAANAKIASGQGIVGTALCAFAHPTG